MLSVENIQLVTQSTNLKEVMTNSTKAQLGKVKI